MTSRIPKRPGALATGHRSDDLLDDLGIEFQERELQEMPTIRTALVLLAAIPLVASGFWIHQEWRDGIEALVRFR